MHLAGQSYRLMALAVGELKDITTAELAGMTQQDAEALAGPLDLTGLLVLSNDLHPASKDTISDLQDKCAAFWLADLHGTLQDVATNHMAALCCFQLHCIPVCMC